MSTSAKGVWGGVASVVLITIVCCFFGTSGYGKVGPDAYRCATALYGACMAKNVIRLDKVEAVVLGAGLSQTTGTPVDMNASESLGAMLSEREKGWLRNIIADARNGNWASAASSAKRMLEDQVEY